MPYSTPSTAKAVTPTTTAAALDSTVESSDIARTTVITTGIKEEIHPARQRFRPGEPVTLGDLERQGSLVLPGYRWEHYVRLDQLFQDSGVRVRFLDNYLEIMAPISEGHERSWTREIVDTHISCRR